MNSTSQARSPSSASTSSSSNTSSTTSKRSGFERIELDQIERLERDVLDAWLRIFQADSKAYVRQHPDWVKPEIARDTAVLFAEWAPKPEQGAELAALGVLIPKSVRTKNVTGPGPSFHLKGVRLAGNRFLLASDADSKLLDTMFERVIAHVRESGADFLMIEDLDRKDPLTPLVEAAARANFEIFTPSVFQPRRRIEVPEKPDAYWTKFSSKTRKKLKRMLRLEKTKIEKITKPEDVPRFLELAHEISKQTWQTRQFGLRIGNTPMEREQLTAAAKNGLLRSYLLFMDDEPVAFLVGNQAHGTFNYEEVGYATQHAKSSPGQVLLVHALEDMFTSDNTPKVFDFGGGDAEYKRIFGNSESESATIWLVPRTPKMRALLTFMRTYNTVKKRIRDWAATSPYATKLRQRIRYGGAKPAGDPSQGGPSEGANPKKESENESDD